MTLNQHHTRIGQLRESFWVDALKGRYINILQHCITIVGLHCPLNSIWRRSSSLICRDWENEVVNPSRRGYLTGVGLCGCSFSPSFILPLHPSPPSYPSYHSSSVYRHTHSPYCDPCALRFIGIIYPALILGAHLPRSINVFYEWSSTYALRSRTDVIMTSHSVDGSNWPSAVRYISARRYARSIHKS